MAFAGQQVLVVDLDGVDKEDMVTAEAKSEDAEDDLRDELAEEALERHRLAALEVQSALLQERLKGMDLKRKRSADDDMIVDEAAEDTLRRSAKRRRQQSHAVLIDTGRSRQVISATSLVNLRPMLYVSSALHWAPGPPLAVRRGACAAVTIDAQRLMVIGGQEMNGGGYGSTEVLDFSDTRRMAFMSGPQMATQRRECAAVMMDHLRLLVVGGCNETGFSDTTEIFDARTQRFEPGPRLLSKRAGASVAMLGLSLVVVVGGKNAYGCLDSSEILDLRSPTLSFVPGPCMNKARAGVTAVPIDESRLMVLGGHDDKRTHNTTEVLKLLDPAARPPVLAFGTGPSLATPRSYFGGVMLNAGNLHILGGHDGYHHLSSTEVLNLGSMEFTTGPRMRAKRFMCAAAAISEDRIVALGGSDTGEDHQTSELLTLPVYSFVPKPWMSC